MGWEELLVGLAGVVVGVLGDRGYIAYRRGRSHKQVQKARDNASQIQVGRDYTQGKSDEKA